MSETIPETTDKSPAKDKSGTSTSETAGAATQCPIGRSLERIGDNWTLLILRDALQGVTRFDEFQHRLGIAPSMLTRRLNSLVADGLLERRPYSKHPPRMEYVLTPVGRDARMVVHALYAWGNKHFAKEGKALRLVDTTTGRDVEPVLVDPETGLPTTDPRFAFIPGPAASEKLKQRYASLEQIRAKCAREAAQTPSEEPAS